MKPVNAAILPATSAWPPLKPTATTFTYQDPAISGAAASGGGSAAVVSSINPTLGSGNLVLQGAEFYTGSTTVNHGTLTLSVFSPPSGVNLHALVLGAVFGFLAFTGFEAAGALGEETVNPGREIPRAIGVSILAIAVFYVACIAVQSLGFGANKAGSAEFASSSGPLFQLSAVYLNGAVRDIILVGAAFSAFGAAVSEAMAGSRLVMALSRDGTPSSPLARISMPSGAPRRAVELIIAVNVVLLLIFQFAGVSGFTIWQYLGTLGTLGILVGYAMVCIAASRAALNGTLQIAKWKAIVPILAEA